MTHAYESDREFSTGELWDEREAFEPVTDALGQDAMQNLLEIEFLRCSAQQRGQSYTAATAVVADSAHVNLPSTPEREGE